jgi:GNAT superfamily N-acetyltransferase
VSASELPPARIDVAESAGDLAIARELFREYADNLGDDICLAGFDAELRTLGAMYGAPDGRLWIARVGGEPAGCVGVRRFDHDSAEMKRLYVRPGFRGRGLGRRLSLETIRAAREMGYRRIVLDTVDEMKAARALYASLGFTSAAWSAHGATADIHFLALPL